MTRNPLVSCVFHRKTRTLKGDFMKLFAIVVYLILFILVAFLCFPLFGTENSHIAIFCLLGMAVCGGVLFSTFSADEGREG